MIYLKKIIIKKRELKDLMLYSSYQMYQFLDAQYICEKFDKLEGSINIVNTGIISDNPRSSKIMTPQNNKK